MKTLLRIILVTALVLWAGVGWADDVIAQQNQHENLSDWTADIPANATSFICGVSGKKITSASLWTSREGSPTGTVVLKIYNITGTVGTNAKPTGSALATSDSVNLNTFPVWSTTGPISFTFSGANQITLTNGTGYCISAEVSGDIASAYRFRSILDLGAGTTDSYKYLGTWEVDDPNRAMYFILYGVDASPKGGIW